MLPTIHRARWREVSGEVLCERELERASRFISPVDRTRFVAGCTFLRRTLARISNRTPAELMFVFGAHGKPALEDGSIHLSLAHAGDWTLVAACSHVSERDIAR